MIWAADVELELVGGSGTTGLVLVALPYVSANAEEVPHCFGSNFMCPISSIKSCQPFFCPRSRPPPMTRLTRLSDYVTQKVFSSIPRVQQISGRPASYPYILIRW